jgi:hypothetical protein
MTSLVKSRAGGNLKLASHNEDPTILYPTLAESSSSLSATGAT